LTDNHQNEIAVLQKAKTEL